MTKRPSTSGGHTEPKKKREVEWSDEDLLPLNEYKKLHKVVVWSSDEELPNQQDANKLEHEKDGWTSDDEIPLNQLIAKWRNEKEKKQESGWSSEDEIPLAQLAVKWRNEREGGEKTKKRPLQEEGEKPLPAVKRKKGPSALKRKQKDDQAPETAIKIKREPTEQWEEQVPPITVENMQENAKEENDGFKPQFKNEQTTESHPRDNSKRKKKKEHSRETKRAKVYDPPLKSVAKKRKKEFSAETLPKKKFLDDSHLYEEVLPVKSEYTGILSKTSLKRKTENVEEENSKKARGEEEPLEETHYVGGMKNKKRKDLKRKREEEEEVEEESPKLPKKDDKEKNELEEKFHRIYYDPGHPAAFANATKLAKAADVTKEAAQAWLISQDTYTLHKEAKQKFRRSRYVIHDLGILFQADLCDTQAYADENDGMRFILTVIDCFSKRAWAIPLKDKAASTVVNAFKTIFRDLKPRYLSSDSGKEFINKQFQTFLKNNGVKFYPSLGEKKGAIIERFNRSLKNRMFKFFTSVGSKRYVDIIQDLISAYNNTTHSATGKKPAEITHDNALEVWDFMYGGLGRYPTLQFRDKRKPKVQIGDRVRITKWRRQFHKATESQNFTPEVFNVKEVIETDPLSYRIVDDKDEAVIGRFKPEEVQKVNKPKDGVFMIDKILETRGKGRSKELLVSWYGYPDNFNSWIKEADLRDL